MRERGELVYSEHGGSLRSRKKGIFFQIVKDVGGSRRRKKGGEGRKNSYGKGKRGTARLKKMIAGGGEFILLGERGEEGWGPFPLAF